jgi:hypothetical protein
MSPSRVIDSWIAELKLSSRRLQSDEEPLLRQTGAGLDAPPTGLGAGPAAPARAAKARPPRYSAIPSPC